ncbi:sporulation/spore germination protein [Stenomitos frigidus]|uniref:Sporulation/spore germination protein n=1 Tax=Stenomitos frigidus ULC18 TaxID=2107698 RepID=A0A2T1DYW0_9CYAN|nr:sporulation/spore germination protein [Stenomitos frigidus ULC18]
MLSLSSCSTPQTPVDERPASISPTSPSPSTPASIDSPPAASPSASVDRLTTPTTPQTTINVYKVDSLCRDLVPRKMTLTAKQSLEGAIAKVLEETDSGDFSIAGYRVSKEGNRAIVDLRLPANTKRSFHSLSSCEQLALFGGIRKTLIDNAQWQIKSVQFTEKGQEIVL